MAMQASTAQFSHPVRPIVLMLIVLGLTGALAFLMLPAVESVFLASPYLNGIILFVFAVGAAACFWQVIGLIASVNWLEGFAIDRPGHEFTKTPRLLASMAALLSQRNARRALTSSSSQSILSSVGTRIEEQRDLTRYIINLLIFLGLLGTFYGLATVVPAVVDTIRSLAPREGQSAIEVFDNLMTGLEQQLGGMGTAFASSLLGLAGSLVVGLLELFATHAQNRFYRELEVWISSITRIGMPGIESEDELTAGNVLAMVGQTAEQIDGLRIAVEDSVKRAEATETLLLDIARVMSARDAEKKPDTVTPELLERIAVGQEKLLEHIRSRDDESGVLDAETRSRLRSIDTQVLRILDDLASGRQDLVTEIRQDLATLAEALRGASGQWRP